MPIRILSWNIEHLSEAKLNNDGVTALVREVAVLDPKEGSEVKWLKTLVQVGVDLQGVDKWATELLRQAMENAARKSALAAIVQKVNEALAAAMAGPATTAVANAKMFQAWLPAKAKGLNAYLKNLFEATAHVFPLPHTKLMEVVALRLLADSPMSLQDLQAAVARYADQQKGFVLDRIVNTVHAANCDVFVLYELQTTSRKVGDLVDASARETILTLLKAVRARAPETRDYRLIPPVVLGPANPNSAIAVIYDRSALEFNGPWMVTAGGFGPISAAGDEHYPKEWKDELPNRSRKINDCNVNENQLAAQTTGFKTSDNLPVDFSSLARNPVFVEFKETQTLARTISLVAAHGYSLRPGPYFKKLATLEQLTKAPATNEVRVVAGDFNMTAGANGECFGDMLCSERGYAYELLYRRPSSGSRFERCSVFKPLNEASCMGTYPFFGYLKGTAPDNALVLSGPGGSTQKTAADAALKSAMILNPVVGCGTTFAGQPMDAQPGYGYVPLASAGDELDSAALFTYRSQMQVTCDTLLQQVATSTMDLAKAEATFRQFDNFAAIRWTSDHLPLVFDV